MITPLTIPDGILFDMDGVLADVRESYRMAILDTCRAFGLELSCVDIAREKAGGNANNDWILTQRLLGKAGILVGMNTVRTVFQGFYIGTASWRGYRWSEQLMIEKDMLMSLFDAVPLGIVTGRPCEEAHWFLDRFGLEGLFSTVVAMEHARPKPDPEPVRLALSQMNLKSAWMIGDTPDDMRAARGAGVAGIGIAPSDHVNLLLEAGASTVLNHPSELIKLIQ